MKDDDRFQNEDKIVAALTATLFTLGLLITSAFHAVA